MFSCLAARLARRFLYGRHVKGKSMYENEGLTKRIIEAIIQVHGTLGPGYLESIYRNALILELSQRGLVAEAEKEVVVYYEDKIVGKHRLDILVQQKVILELKTVEKLGKAHYAQIRSYLKATGLTVGLLINFATEKADFRRIDLKQKSPLSPSSPHPLSPNGFGTSGAVLSPPPGYDVQRPAIMLEHHRAMGYDPPRSRR